MTRAGWGFLNSHLSLRESGVLFLDPGLCLLIVSSKQDTGKGILSRDPQEVLVLYTRLTPGETSRFVTWLDSLVHTCLQVPSGG